MNDLAVAFYSTVRLGSYCVVILLLAGMCFPVLSASPGDTIFTILDPAQDDHGNGRIMYPRDTLFPAGTFDLRALEIGPIDSGRVFFRARMGAPIKAPGDLRISELTSLKSVCEEPFYAFNLDIYLSIPALKDPGLTWLLPGRGAELAAGYRWNRAVILTPQPVKSRKKLIQLIMNSLESESRKSASPKPKSIIRNDAEVFVDTHVWFARNLSIRGSEISAEIPVNWLGSSEPEYWGVLGVITGAAFTDSFDLLQRMTHRGVHGNVYTRPVTVTGNGTTFIGGTGFAGESWIIDATIPDQEVVLNRFDEDRMPRLPMQSMESSIR